MFGTVVGFPIKVKLRMSWKQARTNTVIDNFGIVDIKNIIRNKLCEPERNKCSIFFLSAERLQTYK